MPTNAINDTGVKYLYDKLHGEIEPIAEAVSDSEVTIKGNPLSFNTLSSQNAKSTILSLEPIQDLHGYNKPWVGGAGKNKFGGEYNETFELFIPNGTTVTVYSDTDTSINYYKQDGLTRIDFWSVSPFGRTFTLIEDAYYFRFTNASSTPTKMYIAIEDSFSGYAPYENICPITGRSEIGILGCGKNLYIGSPSFDGYSNINLWNKDTTSYNGHDVYKKDTAWGGIYKRFYLPIGTYVFSLMAKASASVRAFFYINYGSDTQKADYIIYGPSVRNIEQTWSKYFVKFDITKAGYVCCRIEMESDGKTLYISEYQLEYDETTTEYEPYTKSNDLTISLGQTVYGGTLDVENGVLVVDRTYKLVTKNTLSWTKSLNSQIKTGRAGYFSNTGGFPDAPDSGGDSNPNNVFFLFDCSETATALEAVVSEVFKIGVGQAGSAESNLWINVDSSIASTSDFQNYLETNPIQVCYELATPVTINLTPHTINLLKGVNNISTDGDKITLTYRDGSVATLGDLTSAVDELDGKIDESKILTDTATGDKYILVVTNGVLSVEQISN